MMFSLGSVVRISGTVCSSRPFCLDSNHIYLGSLVPKQIYVFFVTLLSCLMVTSSTGAFSDSLSWCIGLVDDRSVLRDITVLPVIDPSSLASVISDALP